MAHDPYWSPQLYSLDQWIYFREIFVVFGSMSNIHVNHMVASAYYRLGLGERYHQPLRQTCPKVMTQNP